MNQRLLLYIIATLFFALLVWLVFRPTGHFSATQNLQDNNPTISKLYPEGRLGKLEFIDSGGFVQTILAEPLYFNVRSPRRMDSVVIALWFRGPVPKDWSLGILSTADPTYQTSSYAFQKITQSHIKNDGAWQQLRLEFDLSRAALVNGHYRFILSIPKYDPATPLVLHKLTADVYGPQFSPVDVLKKLVSLADRCVFYGCR
jgi:hypothetical protein